MVVRVYQRIVKLIYSTVKIVFKQKDVQETLLAVIEIFQEDDAHLYAEETNITLIDRATIDEELTILVRLFNKAT